MDAARSPGGGSTRGSGPSRRPGPGAIRLQPGLVLHPDEVDVSFARSGGPGGQNVNKVETKVLLRFDVASSPSLDEAQRARLRSRLASRLTKDGALVIQSSRTRSRERNLEDAWARLADVLRGALREAKPRKPTRPTRGSAVRRMEGKRRRSDVKRLRRGEEA